MCNPASFVVTKDQVFWSKKSDSHEDIINEFDLKEINVRNEPTFVRVEITPINRNFLAPLSEWNYNLDQDIRPKWYDEETVERRCRTALQTWYDQKVIVNKKDVELKDGNFFVYNSTVIARDNSTVTAWGNSTVTAWGNSSVTAWDNSTVTAWGNSTVIAWCNRSVTARDNSTVTARDNSRVTAWDNSRVTAWGNSRVTAWGNSTVIARDNITVTAMENSTIISYTSKIAKECLKSINAVLVNRSGDNVKCYTGADV